MLKRAKVNVIPRHLRRKRHKHVTAHFHAGLEIGVRSLDAPSTPPKMSSSQAASKSGEILVGGHSLRTATNQYFAGFDRPGT